ncbi:MAG: hypothetical protein ACI9NY_002071 [Kiritimatiellia bacterium]|jgi:uncharacterized protein (DUF3820 family)
MEQTSVLTTDNLQAIVREPMPFGKYQGHLIADLPEEYLLWFNKKGFPSGKLGELLQLALLLNIDGSKAILDPLRRPVAANKAKARIKVKFD